MAVIQKLRPGKTGKVVCEYNIQTQQDRDDLTAVFLGLFGRQPAPNETFEMVEIRPGVTELRIVQR
jgi:hypothetical protein